MARYGRIGTQYMNDSGDPLIAGKLFFTESGSTTDKDTFADVNLTIPNTNPVILTGAGRQPNIFFNGTARVILTDADDVQIELRDPDGAQVSSDTFAPWNAFVSYDFNDIVQASDDRYYTSITNGNIGNDPTTTSDFWMEIRFINVWEATYPFQTGYYATASDDNLYISQIDDNIGNDPTSSPTEWLKVSNTIQNGTANGQILRWVVASGEFQPTSSVLVNDDGDVGINVDPLAKFHVRTGTDQNLHVIDQGSGGISLRSRTDNNTFDQPFNFRASSYTWDIGAFQHMSLTDAGFLEIIDPQTSGGGVRVSFGAIGGPSYSFVGDSNTGIYRPSGDTVGFVTNGEEVARFTINTMLIGNTVGPSETVEGFLYNISNNYIQNSCGTKVTTHTHQFFTNGNGNVGSITTLDSATSYNTSSDYRLKNIIGDPVEPLARLLATPVYHAEFKASPGKAYSMFMAHELADTYPHAVTGVKDAMLPAEPAKPEVLDEEGNILEEAIDAKPERIDPQGVDHSFMVPDIVAAVQELSHKNDRRKSKIVEMVKDLVDFKKAANKRIKDIEARLDALDGGV